MRFLTPPARLRPDGPTHQHEFDIGDSVTSAAAGHVHDLSVPGVLGPAIPVNGGADGAELAGHDHGGAVRIDRPGLGGGGRRLRAVRLRQAVLVAAKAAELEGRQPGPAVREALNLPPGASLENIMRNPTP